MSKPIIISLVSAGLTLSGCANMTPQQQNIGLGAGAGAALGGLIGGLAGGGKGAGIGAGIGAVLGGLAGYALAQDQLTQSSAQTANDWQQTIGTQPETRMTPVAMSNGQTVNQIDEMTLRAPRSKMESGGRLSKSGEQVIKKMVADAKRTGGAVQIYYPPRAPRAVVQSLLDTGVSVQKGYTGEEYVFVVKRMAGGGFS